MYVTAIVLAAGKGERFDSGIPKLLVEIKDKPVIIYSLEVLNSLASVKDIIVVVNKQIQRSVASITAKYNIRKVRKIVLGGPRRQDSVYNALKVIDKRSRLVLVHDAARPFIDKKIALKVVREANNSGAAIVGVPVKATIKEITTKEGAKLSKDFFVKKNLLRDKLWEIQTPQVFKKELILKAYKKFGKQDVTDDAALVEKLGIRIKLVKGSYYNIKITTPEDLVLAKTIAYK